ncbi:TetR family transcriptional regulator [Actinoplanes italicus]|uniref:TetR family transcriptional regulator n=1 Tax=Actinoplanes italicus TaxID=113567 RepID=UPI001941D4E4
MSGPGRRCARRPATRLFAERGCGNTTAEQIAAGAGLSRTAFFPVFRHPGGRGADLATGSRAGARGPSPNAPRTSTPWRSRG